jgi:hypothetical protein
MHDSGIVGKCSVNIWRRSTETRNARRLLVAAPSIVDKYVKQR